MQPIASFTIDHTKLTEGLYLSRVDKTVRTYDLRTRRPNGGSYMDAETMHSVEHLFATIIRNGTYADRVVYFGPMGCQTGFYLLLEGVDDQTAAALVVQTFAGCAAYEGDMPGNSAQECGNYRTLDMAKAKAECRRYYKCIQHLEDVMPYPGI